MVRDYFNEYRYSIAYRVMNGAQLEAKLLATLDITRVRVSNTLSYPSFGRTIFYMPTETLYLPSGADTNAVLHETIQAMVYKEQWFESATSWGNIYFPGSGFTRTHEGIVMAVLNQLRVMEAYAAMEKRWRHMNPSNEVKVTRWKKDISELQYSVFEIADTRGYHPNAWTVNLVEEKTGFNLNCLDLASEFNNAFEMPLGCRFRCLYLREDILCPMPLW